MQTQLIKQRIQQVPRTKFKPVCHKCIYEVPGDFGKYSIAYVRGRLRILLEPIAETLFICPKCNCQFVANNFRDEKAMRNLRRKKHRQRVENLRATYHT